MRDRLSNAAFLLLMLVIASCKSNEVPPSNQVKIVSESVTANAYSPLAARIILETASATKISLKVLGKHGEASDVTKQFDDVSTTHDIPVLGLYAGYSNTVELTFKTASGEDAGKKTYKIQTAVLPDEVYSLITIDKTTDQKAPGMTFVSYFGYKDMPTPQRPFIFDEFGDIRWYLDFTTSPTLKNLFYDDGMERLQNGNLYFGDANTGAIYEIDFFGTIINTWPLTGYNFHHNVQEKPNGNFLVTVSQQGSNTVEDFIIEIDRATKQIVHTWDLRLSLQYNRQTLTTDPVDWVHVNAVIYDETDNTIIVSGRTQGLVKLDQDNHVVWISGCHLGWGVAGDGTDLTTALLQPLDHDGQPITDQDVIDGNTVHPHFEWNWYQHAPMLMPNGHVMVFDNGGFNRNFSGEGKYSRAVEFEINTADMTIRQIWEYGKERSGATLAPIVSDVDLAIPQNHVIFSPGSVDYGTHFGKVIEVDYDSGEILFEATLTPPQTFYGITFHRTERLSLYP